MSENKYPIGGYAPGSYHCKCSTCGGGFFGNKQAVQCEPCALAAKERFDALSPAEQEEVLKRNAEIMNEFIKNNSSTEQLSGTDQVCGKTELNNLATISVTELLYAIIGACDAASEQGLDYPKALAKVKRYAYDALKLDQPKPARAVWVKASAFKYQLEADYFYKFEYLGETRKGIGEFNSDGLFVLSHGPMLPPVSIDKVYILDESGSLNNNQITAALRKFVSMHETGLLPNRFTYEEGKRALEQSKSK